MGNILYGQLWWISSDWEDFVTTATKVFAISIPCDVWSWNTSSSAGEVCRFTHIAIYYHRNHRCCWGYWLNNKNKLLELYGNQLPTRYLVYVLTCYGLLGGAVASWLVRSTPERAVRVRALARDIVLCSWARHFTLTVPLSTQVYKWVPANLMLGGNPAMD